MKPVLQALVLADRIYEDKSGKKIIAGTFNRVMIGSIPPMVQQLPDGTTRQLIQGGTDSGSPSLYISLTDVVDGTEISLQFVNVSKNEVIFQAPIKINTTDRLATVEIVAPLPPASQLAKEPGDFSFDIVWKGETLGSHRVSVIKVAPPPG